MFVLKKFVPELYQIVNSLNINKEVEIKSEDLANKDIKPNNNANNVEPGEKTSVQSESDVAVNTGREDAALENEFNRMEKPSEIYSSLGADNNDPTGGSQKLFKDNKIKYEPKIAAQAIRTMMKRDE
ncbi:MAG: hypothetical protein V1874_02515 [Spirochaetota bacterium]